MKTKIVYILIAMAGFLNSGCEEFIETEQRGKQNLDNYFTNDEECEAFVNGIYSGFANIEEWWKQWLRLTNEMATDDAWMGNLTQGNGDSYPSAHYSITASNAPARLKDFYQHKYYNIAACNLAIHRIADAPVADALKNRLIAEAKFFRAFNYWELVQNWGDVVLILEPTGTTGLNLARSPKADVYTQIVADLKDAEQALPVRYTGEDIGRATKGAAQALLARTYLFMKDYQNAYNYAGLVINSGTYQLDPKFVNIWSVYNHNGVESIFEWQSSSNQSYALGSRFAIIMAARGQTWADPENSMDGWGWCVPTSHLEQAYLSEGDELRRKSTIIKLGDAVYGDETDNPNYQFEPGQNKSCRVWRKFYVPIAMRRQLIKEDQHVPLPYIFLRLGEMYLTRAEAAFFLNKPAEALQDINTLRERVDLPVKTGLSGNDLLYAIWKERRLELANEGMRLYDLRRQIDPVSKKPMIAMVMGPNGSFVKYNLEESTDKWELKHPEERQDKGIMFIAGRHELWPIPQSEIDRSNGMVTQNPGY